MAKHRARTSDLPRSGSLRRACSTASSAWVRRPVVGQVGDQAYPGFGGLGLGGQLRGRAEIGLGLGRLAGGPEQSTSPEEIGGLGRVGIDGPGPVFEGPGVVLERSAISAASRLNIGSLISPPPSTLRTT